MAICLFLLVGCGGERAKPRPAATQTSQAPETTAATPSIRDTSQKPVVPKPTGRVPRKLHEQDLVKGDGRPARAGDRLTVQYVGVTFSTGKQFDDSWSRGRPFSFQLGRGQVIRGWDRGLRGMREGGRRELVIPPRLAYGSRGSPPAIGPNETLVFVIDLVKLR